MKSPVKLPQQIANLLNQRLNDEYAAHYYYRQVVNYCENVGYLKASEYFKGEAEDELKHAEGIQKYLTDWNVQPVLAPVEPPQKVYDLVDILEKAYQMEYDLYEAYEKISMDIFNMKDLCTFDFLQTYRTIQRLAVAEYSTFLNQLETIDNENKNWVYEFEKRAFKNK
jgi:ferritin